jgi:hypothetical protein
VGIRTLLGELLSDGDSFGDRVQPVPVPHRFNAANAIATLCRYPAKSGRKAAGRTLASCRQIWTTSVTASDAAAYSDHEVLATLTALLRDGLAGHSH